MNYRLKLRRPRGQAGQATLEYILILVVVVGIIIGVLGQVNRNFRDWATNYFGDYLACLLEAGELPSFGGGGGECAQAFQEFTIVSGRYPIDGGSGGGSGSGGDGGSGSGGGGGGKGSGGGGSGSGSGTDGKDDAKNDSDSNDGGSNDGSGGGSTAARGGMGSSSSSMRGISGSDGGADDENLINAGSSRRRGRTGSASITDMGKIQDGQSTTVIVVKRGITGGARIIDDKSDGQPEYSPVTSDVGGIAPTKKNDYIKVQRKLAKTDDGPEIGDVGFGDYLRYLIIAAIIIAIVLFIGGQALQVSKSME